jgi:C-terminal processing protease CtpA/Prc
LAATTLAARGDALKAQGQQPRSTAWALQIDGPVATLSLPTWSFWNSRFDWAGFLQASFDQLQAQQVPVLVIDIRANEGGDGAIGERLLSYLIQQPLTVVRQQNVSAYERVPYALARHLDTWDFGFFDRTGDVERITQGTAAGLWRVRSRAAAPRVISPVARPYAGRTFVLVGGENSSATFMFADLVQRSAAATLVGQATGGNQRGLNGGQIAWVNLPNSGVAVDIPLLASTYQADTPDASVTPDVQVSRRFDAAAAGTDLELAAVRAVLERDRAAGPAAGQRR